MVSVLIEDLPPDTADFFHRRARRTGAASVTEHIRHELITLATERAPIDNVVDFARENPTRRLPPPEIDRDATALANAYALPAEAWDTLCLRAAATGVPVSEYVRGELVALSRRTTTEDLMWQFVEAKEADPNSDVDLDAIRDAIRYARGED
ncbi:hypothetical protein [Pseudonocardia humida]|uniref:Ribbon-helix-helix CopG family protein n=1 Tax=Pseudonocardia humida TaxID=2800819 RepID=A0ABT1A588_9PSEU|nr:hypothetical protein [Pseudonocardia humida]MCO1658101.1 hypothetical protein [Pseudonocardia humida]